VKKRWEIENNRNLHWYLFLSKIIFISGVHERNVC
jgi:hypothetical protein